MSLLRFIRSRSVIRRVVKATILLSLCSVIAFLFVHFIVPLPTSSEDIHLENFNDGARILNEIVPKESAESQLRGVLTVDSEQKKASDEVGGSFEYNKCNLMRNDHEFGQLKETVVGNLEKYFGIENKEPFDALCDVLFTVKTTFKNHDTKLPFILDTWINEVSSKVFVVTDDQDEKLKSRLGARLVNTDCEKSHGREALVCKTSTEFVTFSKSLASWWCHSDDDTYINVIELYKLLELYDPSKPWYIGKISTAKPITILMNDVQKTFSFATGGAGFCVSLGLAVNMMPYMNQTNLAEISSQIGLPDDCSIGYISESLLNTKLIDNQFFHSHLEILQFIKEADIPKQISLSYDFARSNLVSLNKFNDATDASRFRSIHCLLFPKRKICNEK